MSSFGSVFRFRKTIARALLTVSLIGAVFAVVGCGTNEPVAAEFGNTVIYEQEVTDYTADFRNANGYKTDASWSLYLGQLGITGSTWREAAIRHIAEKKLIEQRAAELGITANEKMVNDSIENLKTSNGISDDAAWQEYLESNGTTEEKLHEEYGFSSVEQQVISADSDFDTAATTEMVESYIKANLGDVVTRKFSVLSYADDEKSVAESDVKELSELKGSALKKRFEEKVAKRLKDHPELKQGIIGWDFEYATSSLIDGNEKIKLQPGDLYPKVTKGSDGYMIFMCTGRVVFDKSFSFEACDDDELKSQLGAAALSSNWSAIVDEYLASLVEKANVIVHRMPEGLPYDLAPYTEYKDAATAYGEQ